MLIHITFKIVLDIPWLGRLIPCAVAGWQRFPGHFGIAKCCRGSHRLRCVAASISYRDSHDNPHHANTGHGGKQGQSGRVAAVGLRQDVGGGQIRQEACEYS